jgi:hypothetical protein
METFDLKPDAPEDFRGEFRPIATNVPGMAICEHLPRLARHADKFALIRSVHHESPGHTSSTHTVLSAYPGEVVEKPPYRPNHPDFWSVAHRVLGGHVNGVPFHVAMPCLRDNGSAYLGGGLEPLYVRSDPNELGFRVPNLALAPAARERFAERGDLLRQFDHVRREIDRSGTMAALDRHGQKAAALLTSPAAGRVRAPVLRIGKEFPGRDSTEFSDAVADPHGASLFHGWR